MHTARSYNNDGSLEIYFVKFGHWDEFDIILELLIKEINCQVISNDEMIYIRKAVLKWTDINFELFQDDMLGNYIFSKNPEDFELLEKLAVRAIDLIRKKLEK